MAEARHGIRLAEPLDHWLRKAFDSGVGLTAADLDLLADCMGAMESVSRNLDENTGFFHAHDALRERIRRPSGSSTDASPTAARRSSLQLNVDPSRRNPSPSRPRSIRTGVRIVAAVRARAVVRRRADLCAEQTFAVQPEPESEPGRLTRRRPASCRHPVEEATELGPQPLPRRGSRRAGHDADYDPEIAAIFADEATELLEAAQHGLLRVDVGGRIRPMRSRS